MKNFLLILACAIYATSWGQDKNVSGTVVSETGFPIKNVKLTVVDLPVSAKTDKNGKFTLRKVRPEDTIVVHVAKKAYIRFPLGENDSLKLVLSDKTVAIHNASNTIVNTPVLTGTLHNNETRSVTLITAKMLERTNSVTIADALRGMVPGVTVSASSITMRGNKSLNLSQESLVIVDGMETTFEHANGISIHDIHSIEILKDGFGYGVKGANGVVIIKTKKS